MNRRLWMALAFAGAALAYVLLARPGDEARIRGQIGALSAAVRIDGAEAPRARAIRIQRAFTRIFMPSVQVDVPDLVEDMHGRDELAGMAISAAQTFRDLAVALGTVRVTTERPERPAEAEAVITVSGADHDGHPHRETRNVTMRFEKADGEWRIASISAR